LLKVLNALVDVVVESLALVVDEVELNFYDRDLDECRLKGLQRLFLDH